MSTIGWFHRPVKPFNITQHFGNNKACVDLATNSKVISCDGTNPPAGYKSLYGLRGHLGIDLPIAHGQPVFASREGVINFIDTNPRTGLDVRIVSTEQGRTFRHIYEHLLGYQGQVGDTVKTGQVIGWGDNTGYSSGDHLHFQLEEYLNFAWVPVNPEFYLSTLFAGDVLWVNDKLMYIKESLALLAESLSDYLRKRV